MKILMIENIAPHSTYLMSLKSFYIISSKYYTNAKDITSPNMYKIKDVSLQILIYLT